MEKNTQIYGLRAVIEAIQAGETVDKLYLQKGLQGSLYQELEELVKKEGISVSYVPMQRLNRFTQGNHQGAVALISPVQFHDFETLVTILAEAEEPPLLLMLDKLSDVRNFGAILRTAECTGVDAVIIQKKGSAPVSADTVKTSAGAAFRVPIAKVDHLRDAMFYLQSSGFKVVAATEKTNSSVYDIDLTGPTAIIMGAEDSGISPALLKTADELARLPLKGEIGSLNVSVACGVFLYESLRQRMAGQEGS